MKGVVLAGGKGTRLLPLTDPLSKEMLPVYNKPMIIHAIEALVRGGINEIAVVVNRSVARLYRRLLGKFEKGELGCTLTYFIEEKRAGPGQALLLVEQWTEKRDFAVVLGDSVFFNPLPFLANKSAPRLFVMEMEENEDDLRKYGQVKVAKKKVVEMRWKPKTTFSNVIQTTIFLFPADIFQKIRALTHLKEIHISDITARYIAEGRMRYTMLPSGSYLDCGTIEALFQASARIRAKQLHKA